MPVQSCLKQHILPDALVIKNADVVTPTDILEKSTVTVGNGVIIAVGNSRSPAGTRILDAEGLMLLPGFVDIHSDAIETAIQPRPGGVFPTTMALRELDRNLVAYGITTIYHSLSFYDSGQTDLRDSQNCVALIDEIHRQKERLKADTKVHLRFEITQTQALPLVEALIKSGKIHFFSLMDHTPGQGQFVDVTQFRTYYGKVRGKSDQEVDQLIAERMALRNQVESEPLQHLTHLCRRHNIRVAGHDDDTTAKVNWNHQLGVTLSEFPINLEAARSAHACGMQVSLGAPNILRGRSATGNLNAREAIRAGYGSIICSDYAPVALLHAGMTLVQKGIIDLVKMSRMLSSNPARAVGIDYSTGAIEEGKRADLVLVDLNDDIPAIKRTFVQGRQVYASC
jgi:alpha-D-ribose 1-methylphosphonate 5-triphosphate diphosphatase